MADTNRRYAVERDALIPDDATPRPTGGVAGGSGGVKCLHAQRGQHQPGGGVRRAVGRAVRLWRAVRDRRAGRCRRGEPEVVGAALTFPFSW